MSNRIESDDIFDPEIIYCVTKVTIEPFITCIFDKNTYEKGDDYTVAYIESIENKFLCLAFGEELTISGSLAKNVVVTKGNRLMGTVIIVGHKGGTILFNNPLTNISIMYYAYIGSMSETPQFKKISLIHDEDRHSLSSQKDKIYISNIENLSYKPSIKGVPSIEIECVPIGSWVPSHEIYPKRYVLKGWKASPNPLSIKIDEIVQEPIPEFMSDSLPSINEDVEVIHPPTPRPPIPPSIQPQQKISEEDLVRCCCVKYFFSPLYKWFVTKIKSISKKPNTHQSHLSNQPFSDVDLP